ncbi:MAG: response regulator transcription factor [Verrucomicrobiota bacterium]|jgi:two-component system, NarL family, response regulator NreC
MNAKTTLVLAEDHHIVRQGLRALLQQEKNFELLGEAADGLQALQLVEKLQPQVLVTDLMLPRLHGLQLVREVRKQVPRTQVVILSMHADEPYVLEALRYGALGYVLKDCTSSDLLKAIRDVAAGKRYLSPVLSDRALTGYFEHPGQTTLDIFETLTNRERHVLQLAAEGFTSSEIATRLFISPRTAETHRANLMRKLGLSSQTDLVRFAIRKGVISA